MKGCRPISGLEKRWLAADRIGPPFVIQVVLECEGRLDRASWERAAEVVAARSPGVRIRAEGGEWRDDGPLPVVREADGRNWNGEEPAGAPFLDAPLDPWRGPVVEVVLAEPRVVVRAHHAAMDGMAAWWLAVDLFAALRGEVPPAREAGPTPDLDLARKAGARPIAEPPADCALLTCGGEGAGGTWARVRIPGHPSRVLARLAVALGLAAGVRGPYRVGFPVDLRRHAPGLASTANLTGVLRIDLGDALHDPDPVGAIDALLRRGVATGGHAGMVLAAEPLARLPLGLLAPIGRLFALRRNRHGRVPVAATLSSLGRHDLSALRAPGVAVRRAFCIGPPNPGNPLLVTLLGDEDGVEVCASAPAATGGDGRLRELLRAAADRVAGGAATVPRPMLSATRPPGPLRILNAMGRLLDAFGLPAARLDAAALRAAGEAAPALEVLLRSLGESGLSLSGRLGLQGDLAIALANRRDREALLVRHPEIREVALPRPVFVVGLPRTGTTLLHNLLALAPGARVPAFWELLRPCPPPEGEPDTRLSRAEADLRRLHRLDPRLRVIHEITASGPEECVFLFRNAFFTPFFHLHAEVGGYLRWLTRTYAGPAYRDYREWLRILAWRQGGTHLVLKAPHHLFFLDALFEVFPDAAVVALHRDPVAAAGSGCSLYEAMRVIYNERVDLHAIGRQWLSAWTEAACRARPWVSSGRVLPVRYDDLVADPAGVAGAIGARFGLPAPQDVAAWVEAHPAGRHGAHRYSLDRYGLREGDLAGLALT